MAFALHHVSIHGHDVSYQRGGEGPVILLLHGSAGSSRTSREVMAPLAASHTVLAPDLLVTANRQNRSVTTRLARTPLGCATSSV